MAGNTTKTIRSPLAARGGKDAVGDDIATNERIDAQVQDPMCAFEAIMAHLSVQGAILDAPDDEVSAFQQQK